MAGTPGKTLKCTQCSEMVLDMGISSDDYNALNAAQRQELKDRIILNCTEDAALEDESGYDNNEQEVRQEEQPVKVPATKAPAANPPAANAAEAKTDKEPQVVLRKRLGIAGNSRAGRILIMFSKIGLILSLIGSIVIAVLVGSEMYAPIGVAYGLACALICALLCLVLMGIGEVCILLASVNAKLDEK